MEYFYYLASRKNAKTTTKASSDQPVKCLPLRTLPCPVTDRNTNNNNVEAVDEENNATLSSMVGRLKKVEPTVNERFLLRTKEALKKTIAKFEKDVERETNAIQTKQQGMESLYQAILQHEVNAKNTKCYFYLLCFFCCYFFSFLRFFI